MPGVRLVHCAINGSLVAAANFGWSNATGITRPGTTVMGEPSAASHDGKLHVMYRR